MLNHAKADFAQTAVSGRRFEAGRRRRWRTARYTLGVVCACAALYACVANLQWAQVLEAFRRGRLVWTSAAAASVLLTLALVTLRWALLVGTGRSSRALRVLWESVVLGQAVNILVPLRFGEGTRLALTCHGLDAPVGRVMVALALERAFDVAAFAAIVLLLILAGWMPDAFAGPLQSAGTVTLVTIVAVGLIIVFLPRILAWLREHVASLAPAAAWIETQETAIRGGWADVTQRPRLAVTVLLTALIPITAAATNLLVLRGFNLPVPAITALVLLVILQLGTAVVSVPGNIGVFHYLTVVTLGSWGVAAPTAFAVAIVLHIVSLGPKIVLGAFAALASGSVADPSLAK